MTNVEVVLRHLNFVYPQEATNSDIVKATKIEPHQQVFIITRKLLRAGKISGRQIGREWFFKAIPSAEEAPETLYEKPIPEVSPNSTSFESLARKVFSQYYGTPLKPGSLPGIPKKWDLLSEDGTIVGDAKYYTLVGGSSLPPAKFSTIAEHVWLLEKTSAQTKFLVFGNQVEVPQHWLARYGKLVSGINFFFLDFEGKITPLN